MVSLRPWTADGISLLERCDTAEMTAFLGGPETPEQNLLQARCSQVVRVSSRPLSVTVMSGRSVSR